VILRLLQFRWKICKRTLSRMPVSQRQSSRLGSFTNEMGATGGSVSKIDTD
jgi:hypothetical protein